MAAARNGLALRLTRADFEAGPVEPRIKAFVGRHALQKGSTDIILDMGSVEQMIPQGILNMSLKFVGDMPSVRAWRSLTLVSSAFPKSMRVVQKNSSFEAGRSEWVSWRDLLHGMRAHLPRLPTFGDFAIQHPLGVDFNGKLMNVSATIRYALEDSWLLVKGESVDVVPPSVQFPSLARRIVIGEHAGQFSTAAHCKGCEGLARAAGGAPRYGAPEAWRKLGNIHHITRTVEAIRSLPWT